MTRSPSRAKALLLAIALPLALASGSPAQPVREDLAVMYRAADVVYVDAGHADGLVVGQALKAGAAVLEVTHLASGTAACRVVAEAMPVRTGDRFTRLRAAPALLQWPGRAMMPILPAGQEASGSLAQPYLLDPWESPLSGLRAIELGGSISLDWEHFSGRGSSRDFERRVLRVNLRAGGLGGDANQILLRMSNSRYLSSSRDRIYEAAFVRRPQDGMVAFSLGRLGGGSRVGYGPLDGLLGELVLGPAFSVGGFYGSPAELDVWSIDSTNRRYGIFAEYLTAHLAGGHGVDLRLAGIREEMAGETSRDYFTFEGSLVSRGGRWWLRQRAEIDLNSGWRQELSGRSMQVSNLSFGLARRFSGGQRLSISYDRFQLYRTGESRWLAPTLFDDRPRHSLRTDLLLGRSRGWRTSLRAAMRARQGDPDRSYSYSVGVRSPLVTPWRLSLGGNVLFFSNRLSEGYAAHVRASRSFTGGRRLYFDLGRREWETHLSSAQGAQWLRLGGDLQLRRNLSLRCELEQSSGDALSGSRSLVGLRYRIRGRH